MREFFGSAYCACGILHSGEVQCWGDRPTPNFHSSVSEPADFGDVRDITVGYWGEVCVINNSSSHLICINSNSGEFLIENIPSEITDVPVSSVMIGFHHACAVKTIDSSLHCWGNPLYTKGWDDIPSDLTLSSSMPTLAPIQCNSKKFKGCKQISL